MEQITCPNCGKTVYSSSFRVGSNILCPHCNVTTPITADNLAKLRLKSDS